MKTLLLSFSMIFLISCGEKKPTWIRHQPTWGNEFTIIEDYGRDKEGNHIFYEYNYPVIREIRDHGDDVVDSVMYICTNAIIVDYRRLYKCKIVEHGRLPIIVHYTNDSVFHRTERNKEIWDYYENQRKNDEIVWD